MTKRKPSPTFQVRLIGPDLSPERIPIRSVYDVLAAVQDLASGRDPYETPKVNQEKSVGILDVRRGSAMYDCISWSPEEALSNLTRVANFLTAPENPELQDDGLIAAMRPIERLSDVARTIGCQIEIALKDRKSPPIFSIDKDSFQGISDRLLMSGETTIIGIVQRAGGATTERCLLRIPSRRRGLYCNVADRKLVRRLGQHLYEQIVATGTATWIHRTWRLYHFTIRDFTQPRASNFSKALQQLRDAGFKAWDEIPNPIGFIKELRS